MESARMALHKSVRVAISISLNIQTGFKEKKAASRRIMREPALLKFLENPPHYRILQTFLPCRYFIVFIRGIERNYCLVSDFQQARNLLSASDNAQISGCML
jgi:hypothetical protein